MNYLQFINFLGEEGLAAKLKYIAPVEFKIIYRIMHLYNECVKGPDIMIKDPNLTRQFLLNMRSFMKLREDSYGHKQRVQVHLGRDVLEMLRGIICHFVRDPTLIFRALVMHKNKIEASIGGAVLYGS